MITAAGLIFAASMAGRSFSSIGIVIQGGCVIGVGILLDTFVVRTITVPAVAALVGRANWWPSRWGRPLRCRGRRPKSPSAVRLRAHMMYVKLRHGADRVRSSDVKAPGYSAPTDSTMITDALTPTTPNSESSILSMLHGRASLRPDDVAFTFTDYGHDPAGVAETLTWSQLSRRTMNVARDSAFTRRSVTGR